MKHLKSKISRVLVLYILLFSSIVTLVLTGVQLRIDYNNGLETIQQRIEQIKLTNLDSITQSLWTLDLASVEIQLEGLSRINDFIYIEIIDDKNQMVAFSGKIDTKNTITDHIKLHQKYRSHQIELGTLTIVATKENIYQQLIDTIIVILISQAIKTFLVSLFILILFYYLVTRHLENIAKHSKEIELSKKPTMLRLSRKNSSLLKDDELDRVTQSINNMSNNIYNAYENLLIEQKTLADREAKFNAMFDAFSDSVIISDIDNHVLETNPMFNAQFGYKSAEILDTPTSSLYKNKSDDIVSTELILSKNTPSTLKIYEITYRRKDGSTFLSETMGGPIFLSDGKQLGYISIIRDITKRKESDKEKSLLEKKLQQSQKMEAIGQLTGGIAHDFNNILSSILGYSKLSIERIESSPDEKLEKYLKQIKNAGERARDLVRQLLTFSRNAPVNLQPLELNSLIEDVVALIRPSIPSSIELKTIFNGSVPSVFMDITQMHQLLMNLCINGRDAIDGHGSLTIKLDYQKNMHVNCASCRNGVSGDFVVVSVQDSGSGIDKKVLDTIFEAFLTTKEKGKGTGMGLSVVHGILHKNHSHIVIETGQSMGTNFKLLIPPNINIIPETNIIKNPETTINNNPSTHQKHIFLVDDEAPILEFLEILLESKGYYVTTTTRSEGVISHIKNCSPSVDLIITDQTMPGMTGTELMKKIIELNIDIPVILSSGYGDQINEESANQLGFAKFINKPYKNEFLLQTIREILT